MLTLVGYLIPHIFSPVVFFCLFFYFVCIGVPISLCVFCLPFLFLIFFVNSRWWLTRIWLLYFCQDLFWKNNDNIIDLHVFFFSFLLVIHIGTRIHGYSVLFVLFFLSFSLLILFCFHLVVISKLNCCENEMKWKKFTDNDVYFKNLHLNWQAIF